jgi:hypothetical protein
MTNEEYLAQVETAIANILAGGQRYTIDTPTGRRTVERADLSELRSIRDELTSRVARETNGGVRIQYGVIGNA